MLTKERGEKRWWWVIMGLMKFALVRGDGFYYL